MFPDNILVKSTSATIYHFTILVTGVYDMIGQWNNLSLYCYVKWLLLLQLACFYAAFLRFYLLTKRVPPDGYLQDQIRGDTSLHLCPEEGISLRSV